MKYQKKQEWKKKIISVVAILMAVILVFSMAAPFMVFGAPIATEQVQMITTVVDETEPPLEEGTFSGAKEKGSELFRADIGAGYDGSYIVDQTMPVSGVITNLGADFRGEVQIKAYTQNGGDAKEYMVYFQKLEFGQGASKTIDMEVTMGSIHKNLELSLVDESGKTVFLKNITLKAKSPATVLVGVLSERKEEMSYLKNLNLIAVEDGFENSLDASAYQQITFLEGGNFPNTLGKINAFHTIMIEDWDTSSLSQQQKDALTQWVQGGGTLVVGTGVNGKKVLKGLEFLQDVAITGTKDAPVMDEGHSLVTLAELSGEGRIKVAENEGNTFISYEKKGLGSVIFTHFALSLAPMAGKTETIRHLEQGILTVSGGKEIINEDEQRQNRDNFRYNVQRFPAVEGNAVVLIMGIVGVYILVVGPLLYLYLKKKDCREKGWVIIPFCSVIFTAVVFFLAQGSGYKTGMLHTVAVVEMTADNPVAMADVGIAIKTPKRGDVTVTSTEKLLVNIVKNYNYYYTEEMPERERGTHRILCGDTTEVTFLDSPSWGDQYFATQRAVDLGGNVESTIALSADGFSGELINHSAIDFTNLTLILGGYSYHVTDLGAGETKEISVQLEELQGTMEQHYGGYYNYETQEAVRRGEISRKEAFKIDLQRNLRNDFYRNAGEGMLAPIQFFGYGDTAPAVGEILVGGKKLTETAMTMYYQAFPLVFSGEEMFTSPIGGEGIDVDSKVEVHDNGQIRYVYAQEDGEVRVHFQLPIGVVINKISPVEGANKGEPMPEVMEFMNHVTGAWEEIKENQEVLAAPYIEGNNRVSMRFQLEKEQQKQIPQLMITGGGQGA